jgi:4-amino-4-deoxy-L-arabinose transferase-like glycosyltransferase
MGKHFTTDTMPNSQFWTRIGSLLFLIILAAGAYLRLDGLGHYGFWTDELFHIFAAKSFLTDGSFLVPWEPREYTRAWPVTLLTALSFRLFGESEATARFFFALFNIIFIVVAYKILKDLFCQRIALIFAAASAFSVISIQVSQECRMYTLFQLTYFLMSISFLKGFESAKTAWNTTQRNRFKDIQIRTGISIVPLLLAVGLGLFSLALQSLTALFGLVLISYCLCMLINLFITRNYRESAGTKYSVCLILCLAVAWFFSSELSSRYLGIELLSHATQIPKWFSTTRGNFDFYRQVLTDSHPILWVIYPIGAFLGIRRYGKTGLFLVLSFVVPFLLLCFAFGRQSERYIFNVLPFFVVISAVGLDFIFLCIKSAAPYLLKELSRRNKRILYIAGSLSLALFVSSSIQRTVLDSSVAKFSNWKDLDPTIIKLVNENNSITTDRLRFSYYFKPFSDYVIDASDTEKSGGDKMIVNLSDLKAAVAEYPDLVLVTYGKHIYNGAFVDSQSKDFILNTLKRIDSEDDNRIMVFHGKKSIND